MPMMVRPAMSPPVTGSDDDGDDVAATAWTDGGCEPPVPTTSVAGGALDAPGTAKAAVALSPMAPAGMASIATA
jgi:hypothetical protein